MRQTYAALLLGAVSLCAACAETVDTSEQARLAAFEAHDRADAKAVYRAMSDGDKATLWRAHFAREAADRQFTAAENAVLAEAEARLPELVGQLDADLAARAESVFGEVAMAALFELPGRWAPDEARPNVAGVVAESCDSRWCVCAVPPTQATACNGEFCTATSSGCGWFGQQGCTRECYIAE